MNTKFVYELSEKQEEKLNEWMEAIKFIHGEYGHFSYTFTPTGIGEGVEVYSHLTKTKIDLTDMDSW